MASAALPDDERERLKALARYAVLTLTAVAFAGVLFKVISSPKIQTELSGIIEKALS